MNIKAPLGSIPELPAESCKEIKQSEGIEAVSGEYWFHSSKLGISVLAYCDMETEGNPLVNILVMYICCNNNSIYGLLQTLI